MNSSYTKLFNISVERPNIALVRELLLRNFDHVMLLFADIWPRNFRVSLNQCFYRIFCGLSKILTFAYLMYPFKAVSQHHFVLSKTRHSAVTEARKLRLPVAEVLFVLTRYATAAGRFFVWTSDQMKEPLCPNIKFNVNMR